MIIIILIINIIIIIIMIMIMIMIMRNHPRDKSTRKRQQLSFFSSWRRVDRL
jgi:flagellar basal body-associated protein FliL